MMATINKAMNCLVMGTHLNADAMAPERDRMNKGRNEGMKDGWKE